MRLAERTPSTATALEVAEEARRQHYVIATSSDPEITHCWSPVYRASRVLFIAAIKVAYPDLDEYAIYGVWVDCNETVAYCAAWVAANADCLDQHRQALPAHEAAMLWFARSDDH